MDIGQYTVIETHDRSDIFYSLRAAEVSVAHHLVIIVCRIGLKPQRLGHIAVPYGGIVAVLASQGYGVYNMRRSGVVGR